MSLSPLSAIADMVAPVVLITLATIFANVLLTGATAAADRMFALNRERRDILTGPQGERLDEDSVPPRDRERLSQIGDEEPLILRRVGRIRNGVLIIWIAIGLLVLSVAAIAVAATAHSEPVAFVALAPALPRSSPLSHRCSPRWPGCVTLSWRTPSARERLARCARSN